MTKTEISGLDDSLVPTQTQGYTLQKTPCCFFLRSEETQKLTRLNDSGVIIWQICSGEWNIGEMVEVLQESYPDAADNIQNDVYTTLAELQKEGIVAFNKPSDN